MTFNGVHHRRSITIIQHKIMQVNVIGLGKVSSSPNQGPLGRVLVIVQHVSVEVGRIGWVQQTRSQEMQSVDSNS